VVSGRLSHNDGVFLLGFAITIAGLSLGIRAGRSNMQIYVRELIPGGTNQADPFAGQPTSTQPAGAARSQHAYIGTVVWPGGIGKGVRLELTSSGLSITSTWISGLLMSKQPSFSLPWSSVRAVELATVPGMGSAPAPVKFSIAQPTTVFLFFYRMPTALLEDVRRHMSQLQNQMPGAGKDS